MPGLLNAGPRVVACLIPAMKLESLRAALDLIINGYPMTSEDAKRCAKALLIAIDGLADVEKMPWENSHSPYAIKARAALRSIESLFP